jgi:hypothetical protein
MATPTSQDAAIEALAARQQGNVTRRQLLDLGLTPKPSGTESAPAG